VSNENNGGPAFPNVPDGAGDKWQGWDQGMTLRDYFAAKAMQSVIVLNGRNIPAHASAYQAYEVADAMLKERDK